MVKQGIKVEGLEKKYGDVKVVDGLSFEVEMGMIFGMLGPNGAGKTTTIEMLTGLKERNAGTVEILGYDPAKEADKLKKRIGIQLQFSAYFARLTVKEILELFASFYNNPLGVENVIDMIGLTDKMNARILTLSGGQAHRVAVALAMISNGDIILLDEPTTGLDPKARRKLWEAILRLKDMGKIIFLTTHFMDEAEILCDDLLIIDNGKTIAQGSPNELLNQYFGGKSIEFIAKDFETDDIEKLKKIDGVVELNYNQDRKNIILYTDNSTSTMMELMQYSRKSGKTIDNLQFRKATIEDLFLKITGRGIENEGI